jgi:hypothetical protein
MQTVTPRKNNVEKKKRNKNTVSSKPIIQDFIKNVINRNKGDQKSNYIITGLVSYLCC